MPEQPDLAASPSADGSDHGVTVTGLSVSYGKAMALNGVDLEFPAGRIHAIVGPNGAGKSSLLLALYGAVSATGGVSVGGREVSALRPAERAQAGIGLVPQGRQIFPTLTVRENLAVFAEVLREKPGAVDEALARFPRLVERAGTLAGNLSGGEQQMLAVTRALMTRSEVLLFDEMCTGLAPVIVEQLLDVARTLATQGSTVIMAEASVGPIRGALDDGVVLVRGAVVDRAVGGDALLEAYRSAMGVTG